MLVARGNTIAGPQVVGDNFPQKSEIPFENRPFPLCWPRPSKGRILESFMWRRKTALLVRKLFVNKSKVRSNGTVRSPFWQAV